MRRGPREQQSLVFCRWEWTLAPHRGPEPIEDGSEEDVETEREKFKALCFLLRSDESRYGELQNEIKKGIFRGRDEYPTTVEGAYDLMLKTSNQAGYKRNNIL